MTPKPEKPSKTPNPIKTKKKTPKNKKKQNPSSDRINTFALTVIYPTHPFPAPSPPPPVPVCLPILIQSYFLNKAPN